MENGITISQKQVAELVSEYKQARKSFEKAMENNGHNAEIYRTAALAIQRCMIVLGIDREEYGC